MFKPTDLRLFLQWNLGLRSCCDASLHSRFNARLDAQLARAVAQLEQEGFRDVTYLGDARYSVTLERACTRGSPSFFPSREMSVFSIRSQIDGLIVVAASPYDPAAPYHRAGTDAEIDGVLLVMADMGIEVVQHNAPVSQSTSNSATCFIWRIKSPYDNPRIILRLPETSARTSI